MGDHYISHSGTDSVGAAHHCVVEAGLLQAQSAGPDVIRELGEEQPRGQSLHRP